MYDIADIQVMYDMSVIYHMFDISYISSVSNLSYMLDNYWNFHLDKHRHNFVRYV
jgi:hypothetical protein